MRNSLTLAVALTVLAGCASGPDYQRPALDLPAAVSQDSQATSLSRWWTAFNDATLNGLIDDALRHNQDLKMAVARVDEARALVDSSRVSYLPQVDAAVNSSRTRPSHRTASYRPGGPDEITNHQATLNVSYELDLWGKIRRANEAADATLLASREAQHAAQAAIAAQVAQTYFQLRALDKKVDLAMKTLTTRDEALKLQQARFKSGVISSLDLARAESEREAIVAALPSLSAAQQKTERALALLAGRSPKAIAEGKITRPQADAAWPTLPTVPSGLSADVLNQRPDIRQSEASLIAANARVGEARAQYYPSISLTGAFGSASESLSKLFSGDALMWNVAGSLVQPLVGLKRIDAQVNQAEARKVQQQANYVKTVQMAFKEALDALTSRSAAVDVQMAQSRRLQSLAQATKLAKLRYQAGQGSYLELLDAERNLYSTDMERVESDADALTATVDVYRAFGGGWSEGPPSLAAQ
ncbi:multidrug efflux system outer membrane protein [Chitinivorax tropicus]|uniref:Multidrug efflux system outer membrane protein n=1 Tax=Chitinivorax tropicus TaxID=714531 RepID=A0A840MS62_9PROT|nr:efflux transporter outer membrane subunit [Chitinivorax tropicus]MBB5019612.1 multidrug efflux system outer membrane protein [Chitinivorax tropicus]